MPNIFVSGFNLPASMILIAFGFSSNTCNAVSGCSPSTRIKSASIDVSIDNFLIGGFFEVNIVLDPLLILAMI